MCLLAPWTAVGGQELGGTSRNELSAEDHRSVHLEREENVLEYKVKGVSIQQNWLAKYKAQVFQGKSPNGQDHRVYISNISSGWERATCSCTHQTLSQASRFNVAKLRDQIVFVRESAFLGNIQDLLF